MTHVVYKRFIFFFRLLKFIFYFLFILFILFIFFCIVLYFYNLKLLIEILTSIKIFLYFILDIAFLLKLHLELECYYFLNEYSPTIHFLWNKFYFYYIKYSPNFIKFLKFMFISLSFIIIFFKPRILYILSICLYEIFEIIFHILVIIVLLFIFICLVLNLYDIELLKYILKVLYLHGQIFSIYFFYFINVVKIKYYIFFNEYSPVIKFYWNKYLNSYWEEYSPIFFKYLKLGFKYFKYYFISINADLEIIRTFFIRKFKFYLYKVYIYLKAVNSDISIILSAKILIVKKYINDFSDMLLDIDFIANIYGVIHNIYMYIYLYIKNIFLDIDNINYGDLYFSIEFFLRDLSKSNIGMLCIVVVVGSSLGFIVYHVIQGNFYIFSDYPELTKFENEYKENLKKKKKIQKEIQKEMHKKIQKEIQKENLERKNR